MRGSHSGRRLLLGLFALAVVVQVLALYAPNGPGDLPFPEADKVVHALLFLVPVLLALFAGLRAVWVVGAFAAHAVVSELVQYGLLPGRSGDPVDVVADLTGIALGLALWWLVVRRTTR